MADKSTRVSTVQLKGPAGSVTTNPRTYITAVNLHGPVDKRTVITQVTLVAPPKNLRTRITQVQLVGSSSTQRPVYYGSPGGWVPVDLYLPGTSVWIKVP